MKRKVLIIASIALVVLCVVIFASHQIRLQEYVDAVWSKLESGDISVMNNSAYAQCKDSAQLKNEIASYVEAINDPQKLACLGVTLSQVGYDNAEIKNALITKIKLTLPNTKTSPNDYLATLALISEAEADYFNLHDILSEQDLVDYLDKNFTSAILQKDIGGYYDGQKNLNNQYTNDLLYTITENYAYCGDFHLYNYDSKAYRPTGEQWEDELMSDYDEKRTDLYYQDKLLDCPAEFKENFLNYTYGVQTAYVLDNCIVIIRNGKFYTTSGNILYNRETSAYEELAIHAAAICIPEASYDDAGNAAMWYFKDNKELFPLLNERQILELMPGQWTFYYMYAGELSVDFDANGTYTEHYKNSDQSYPWGVENDLLSTRTRKDGSWQIQHEVREITDELYLLYEPGGKVEIAIKKVK